MLLVRFFILVRDFAMEISKKYNELTPRSYIFDIKCKFTA